MMNSLMIMMLITGTLMIFSNHPTTLGLMTILQSLMIAIISPMFLNTPWFSLTLFIIFTGGLMVLFIYMTSLASNEPFQFPKFNMMMIFLIILLTTPTIIFTKMHPKFPYDHNPMMKKEYLLQFNPMISHLYSSPSNMMTFLMILFLLVTLMGINKVTSKKPGPLRTTK